MLLRFPCIFPFFRVFFTLNPFFVFLTSFLLGLYYQNPREKGGAYSSDDYIISIVLLVKEQKTRKKALRSFDNADGCQPSITANPNDAGATTNSTY